MAPAATRKTRASRATRTTRQPLVDTVTPSCDPNEIKRSIEEAFNNFQHVTSADIALTQLKKLYKTTEFSQFENHFKLCLKRLLKLPHHNYFETSIDTVCKFLEHVSKLSDEEKAKIGDGVTVENTKPAQQVGRRSFVAESTSGHNITRPISKQKKKPKAKSRRKFDDDSEDELAAGLKPRSDASQTVTTTDDEDSLLSTTVVEKTVTEPPLHAITGHDKIISSCVEVALQMMLFHNDEWRYNAVYFVFKFTSRVESLDEDICEALKRALLERIRDRKPKIRAQAVIASRIFQDHGLIHEAYKCHYRKEPELVVRRALIQVMDPKIFGYEFLVKATQDITEVMRKIAYRRLGDISPDQLNRNQLHTVIHNGLNERSSERQAQYSFRNYTLVPWLNSLYDGVDLYQLLEPFDLINYDHDIRRLIEVICEKNLQQLESNGTSTKLHQVVEAFRERWLVQGESRLPDVEQLDCKLTCLWLNLVRYCQGNQNIIKPIRVRTVKPINPNESIAEMLDSQEQDDDVIELYERITPDLVGLLGFLKSYVNHSAKVLKQEKGNATEVEYIYHRLLEFVRTYQVCDDLERKTVVETFDTILRENLLTGYLETYLTPIVRSLSTLIYPNNPNKLLDYISESIQDVRSHLEDLISPALPLEVPRTISNLKTPCRKGGAKSNKRVTISDIPRRISAVARIDEEELELKIANTRVDIEDLKDKLDLFIKNRDFDQAKIINEKLSSMQAELGMLQSQRRDSRVSDISQLSMVVEENPTGYAKLSSTLIGDTSMQLDEEQESLHVPQDVRLFRNRPNELIKCFEMYFGCVQSLKNYKIPQTMINHLKHLTQECLDDHFKSEKRVRSLMISCHATTALCDIEYAKQPTTSMLLLASCFDADSLEVKTVGFKGLVDIIIEHEDIEVPMDRVEKLLRGSLREYGKYNDTKSKSDLQFITALIEGTSKLLYYGKISSPEILSHLIIWWYHPHTHSKLRQFIGIFLPLLVQHLLEQKDSTRDTLADELLEKTFVVSIEYLHDYILGPGFEFMAASDMNSLISFLCNLIPIALHPKILIRLEERIDDLSSTRADLMLYMKLAKNSLTISSNDDPMGLCPIEPTEAAD